MVKPGDTTLRSKVTGGSTRTSSTRAGPFDDYNLNADVGLRAALIQSFFADVKIELRYDSTPAKGAEKEDLRYLIGVGWSF